MSKEQRARIDAMMRQPQPDGPRSIEALRTGFEALMAGMAVPDGIRTTRTTLGDRPALHVEPDSRPRAGTILYFHGGGWVVGSPETALSLTAHLVTRTGFTAYSTDYRLAPEHPFPAAIDDTLSAYRALLDSGEDPAAIAFAGDSAGGGLTVTTCLAARDAGLPLPAAIVAFSPGLDATRTGASIDTKEGIDPIFTRASVEHTGAMYLAGADPNQPLLSPAVLADLTGFPPTLIQVGTNEILLDDSTRLAARARAVGVDVILDVTADVPHVFQSFAGLLDEADEALDRAALFLTQRIGSGRRCADQWGRPGWAGRPGPSGAATWRSGGPTSA
ncbi:alpha/beta hydrolase [Actinacidiphila acididurans]|uniref:Alpha/beta hydrolase n=1 Tax=Actinacidiphila acididurans TaxID=2784346 RepID=A0ABS2TK16_9ACTN|nr:alpha/beta hydrolase [Actinacidiphila acididurans]MBM9503673.1 alpha/beta hydrolase [Actinacidiphila acididurans]